jgi:hypothetical protein
MDLLDGLTVNHGKAGTPRLVTLDDLVQALLEHGYIEWTRQVNCHALVIDRSIRYELGEKPQLLLSEGKRRIIFRGVLRSSVALDFGPREITLQILLEQASLSL